MAKSVKPPTTLKLNARQRWEQALRQRNLERDDLRTNKLHGTPLAPSTTQPTGEMMVRRGTRMISLTRRDASAATRKSWQARKQKYGKKGRVSRLTFAKTHNKTQD